MRTVETAVTMKITKKREVILGILLGCAILLLSMAQTLLDVRVVPGGTVFPLVHNYYEDYYYYLHLMRQGWEGWWRATSWFTPEVFPAQLVNPFFLLLGHLARIFGVSLPITYMLGRVVGGLLLLILTYRMIMFVFPASAAKRLAALFLVGFGSYWWGWDGKPTVPTLTHLWTELDPMVRMSFIPHHLWSKAFMLAGFLCLLKIFRSRRKLVWGIAAVASTAAAGFTSPVVLATLVPTVGLWIGMESTESFQNIRKGLWKSLIFPLVIVVAGLSIMWYHRQLELGVFPWTSYKPWEDAMRYPVSVGAYLQALGPTFPLFLVAAGSLWRMGMPGRLILAWAASSWIMVFVAGPFVPLSNIRFIEGYQFIPLGIGAAWGIWTAGERISQIIRLRPLLIIVGFLAVIGLYSTGAFQASWSEHRVYLAADLTTPSVYVPVPVMETLRFLDTTPKGVVAAPYWLGSMIPPFTGQRVVAGHRLMTQDVTRKKQELDRFYSFVGVAGAAQTLASYRVSYVIAEQTNPIPQSFARSLGFSKVFENSMLAVYEVGYNTPR